MKIAAIVFLLTCGAMVGALAWTHGNNCSNGGFLVTGDGTCLNILTTGGGDPLTP